MGWAWKWMVEEHVPILIEFVPIMVVTRKSDLFSTSSSAVFLILLAVCLVQEKHIVAVRKLSLCIPFFQFQMTGDGNPFPVPYDFTHEFILPTDVGVVLLCRFPQAT